MTTPDSVLHRDYSPGEMIADAGVHGVAIIAGVIGFSVLFERIATHGAIWDGAAMAVYATGFFLLFGFSCAYNMAPPSPAKGLLRRLDHTAIYLMIGGTYTALLSQTHDVAVGVALAIVVWTGVAIGMTLKLFLPGRFDRAAIAVYLALGWSALVAFRPLVADLPATTLALVLVGGGLYSLGVVFYLWRSLKFQNAIWHALVTIAAGCHFAGILRAVGN
jgi:hemolysin III